MTPPFNENGAVVGINLKLMGASLAGLAGWWLWPTEAKWWGFGVYSIIAWGLCVGLTGGAIRRYFKLRSTRRRWKSIEEMGSRPKNARLATKADLQNKGMNP